MASLDQLPLGSQLTIVFRTSPLTPMPNPATGIQMVLNMLTGVYRGLGIGIDAQAQDFRPEPAPAIPDTRPWDELLFGMMTEDGREVVWHFKLAELLGWCEPPRVGAVSLS